MTQTTERRALHNYRQAFWRLFSPLEIGLIPQSRCFDLSQRLAMSDAATTPLPKIEADKPEGPWRVALRKLMRDRTAVGAIIVLLVIILACCAAPFYAQHISQTDPFQSKLDGQITIGGNSVDIMQACCAAIMTRMRVNQDKNGHRCFPVGRA
jgi:N-terminal TM domain of oligopeptide transport permease C